MGITVGIYWGLWNIVAADGGGAGGLYPFLRRSWAASSVREGAIDRLNHSIETRIETNDSSPLRCPVI